MVICVAGVGGFFRVVDGRSEGGSEVVGAVLFDVDEGREALAVGLGYYRDQVGEEAAVVMRSWYRGNKVDFWGSVCAEISFHTWCIHSFVHTFQIWSAVHTPTIYVNTGGGTSAPFFGLLFLL